MRIRISATALFLTIFTWQIFGQSPDDPEALLAKAKFNENLIELKKAETLFDSLRTKDPDNHLYTYYKAEINYQKALYFFIRQNKDQALQHLETARQLIQNSILQKNNFSDSHRLYADILGLVIAIKGLSAGAQYGQLINKEAAKAKTLDPKNPKAYLTLGITYANTPRMFGGDNHKAISHIRQAIALDQSFYEAYAWLGIVYKRLGKVKLAQTNLHKALSINPHYSLAKHELGLLHEK